MHNVWHQFTIQSSLVVLFPDESLGYHAFIIVMPLPLPLLDRFLVCPLHPTVLVLSFSSLGHVSCSKKFTPYIPQTQAQMPINFQCFAVPLLATRGPNLLFLYVPCNPWFSTDLFQITPNIHWTMFQYPVYFCHRLFTFMDTRGPNAFFPVCAHNPWFSTDLF